MVGWVCGWIGVNWVVGEKRGLGDTVVGTKRGVRLLGFLARRMFGKG